MGSSAIDIALGAWFGLTMLSAAYVAYDAFRRTPEMTVMKWGWVLVTLYTGPIGGALYVLSCQEPGPGTHEDFVRPLWKQALGSTIHCLAGDATGIIVAAAVTMALGLRMWQDLVAEYVFGFAFGLLVFQSLFMRDMAGGSYRRAVRMSLLPEWLSMNGVMAGMVPVMVVLMSRDMPSMEPASLRFWGVMSLATLAGLALAYPVNVWLVAVGLKHGMGTVGVLGEGGHSVAAERARSTADEPVPAAAAAGHGAHLMPTQSSGSAGGERRADASPAPRAHSEDHVGATASGATRAQVGAVTMLTVVALGAGVLVATLGGDLTMRGRMPAHAGAAPVASDAAPAPARHDMTRMRP